MSYLHQQKFPLGINIECPSVGVVTKRVIIMFWSFIGIFIEQFSLNRDNTAMCVMDTLRFVQKMVILKNRFRNLELFKSTILVP